MATQGPIGEDDLQAYIDERLAPARRAMVEGFLHDNPDLKAEIDKQRDDRDALRSQLAAKFVERVPARLRIDNLRAAQAARRAARMRSLAASIAMIGIGLAGGWVIRGEVAPQRQIEAASFVASAVDAHKTYVVEVAHPVEVAANDEAHLVKWLSNRSGRVLQPPPNLTPFGYSLVGGRVLPGGNTAAAQLMYEDAAGARLTVYLRAGGDEETAFTFTEWEGVSTFVWIDGGFQFAIAAELDRDRLLPIATRVYERLA